MQPVLVLTDHASDSLTGAGSTPKYGTNSDGEIIEVGSSSALPDISTALIYLIGISIVLGFVVWIIRYGRGGMYETDYRSEF